MVTLEYARAESSVDHDNLIQYRTRLRERLVRHSFKRMRPSAAKAPVKRLRLVAQHVTGLACVPARRQPRNDGERIGRVVCGSRHR